MERKKVYFLMLTAIFLLSVMITVHKNTNFSFKTYVEDKLDSAEYVRPPFRRLPDALVVGAGKCGTDALITYLNTSDQFVVSNIHTEYRELNYYNYNYDQGIDWYMNQMPLAQESQVLVEKCAPYMWNPEVPPRIRSTKPDTKIIMVLCDPVKRVVSIYTHKNSYGAQVLPDFTTLIHIQDGELVEEPDSHLVQPLLQSSLYSEFIKQWLQHFSRDQMLFISGENLITNPLAEVSKVTEFLNKPNSITSDNIYYDEGRGFYCFKNNQGVNWCMDRSQKGRTHPVLPKPLIDAMHEHFKPYNKQLVDLIGQDFGWPKYFGQH